MLLSSFNFTNSRSIRSQQYYSSLACKFNRIDNTKRYIFEKDLKLLHFVIIAIGIGLLWVGTIIFRYSGICEAIVSPIIHSSDINPPDERLANTQEENPDTMAWITIPGTNIDAPVQQYGDNDYYLRRDEKELRITTAASMPTTPAAWTAP